MAKRRSKPEIVGTSPETPTAQRQFRIDGWVEARALLITVALIAIATLRIASTYTTFSHTSDEPAHVACGMEWLTQGIYQYESQHPPLSRIAAALLPYLDGSRGVNAIDMWWEGRAILIKDKNDDRKLALARAGNLPFFWVASAVVFLWARRMLGPIGGVTAVLLFTNLPPILGHAGLATTDMALTAFLGAALFAFLRLIEDPSWARGAMFGLCGGLAVVSKFSSLAYFPVALAAAFGGVFLFAGPGRGEVWQTARRVAPKLLAAATAAFLIIWAIYRFSFGKIPDTSFTAPFPELFSGIFEVADHNRWGHGSYLLGERRQDGWFAYFPVVLAIKTPVAFLCLAGIGLFRSKVRRGVWSSWVVWAMAAGMLIFAMTSRINIGVRHVLPLYTFLAIGAAAGVLWLGEKARKGVGWAAWLAGILLLWNIGQVAITHPDYLAYFNEIAGSEPEEIIVDSDLDWGQDIKRLGQRLKEVGAKRVTFTPGFPVDLAPLGFPPVDRSDPRGPSPGWNAVSLTYWKSYGLGAVPWKKDGSNREQVNAVRAWPDFTPKQERVGRGMLLYYFPDPDAPKGP